MAGEVFGVIVTATPQPLSRVALRRGVRRLTPLALALAIVACSPSNQPRIEIVRDGQPNHSNYNLLFEHWTEASLANLARDEKLIELVGDQQRPFEIALTLQSWTSREMRLGFPDPYPKSNAADILSAIRSGTTRGFCAQYSYVLVDVLKALGFYAVRYVEAESSSGSSHFAVELWSDEFQKWVLLDALYNIYYIDPAETPMSSLEVHDLAVTQRYDSATREWTRRTASPTTSSAPPGGTTWHIR
jgi:hypothetical protein